MSVVEKSINHTPAAAAAIHGAREKIAGKGLKESTLDASKKIADFDNKGLYFHLFILLSIFTVKRLIHDLLGISIGGFSDHIADPTCQEVKKNHKYEQHDCRCCSLIGITVACEIVDIKCKTCTR